MTASEIEKAAAAAFFKKDFSSCLSYISQLESLGVNDTEMQVNKSQCLYHLKRAPEAIAILKKLLLKQPANANYLIRLALYLRAVGEFDASDEAVSRVPEDTPGWASITGWHLIRKGKFTEGYQLIEKEPGLYRMDDLYKFPKEKKLQKGTAISGKRVLLVLEGGAGDEIAFVRFAQILKKMGARVFVAASDQMRSIIARAKDVEKAYAIGSVPEDSYDYYIGALSVIPFFNIRSPDTDITFPYISADKEYIKKWKEHIADNARAQKKIGIQWQGNTEFDYVEFKTIPAALLGVFAKIGSLFSLQRDPGENIMPKDIPIVDTQTEPANWEDTLAVINEMDYIIAGDTTITHLAGAMNKKVLALLPHGPHPYWTHLTDTTPWYPNLRIFRQPKYNDWQGAIERAYAYINK